MHICVTTPQGADVLSQGLGQHVQPPLDKVRGSGAPAYDDPMMSGLGALQLMCSIRMGALAM